MNAGTVFSLFSSSAKIQRRVECSFDLNFISMGSEKSLSTQRTATPITIIIIILQTFYLHYSTSNDAPLEQFFPFILLLHVFE